MPYTASETAVTCYGIVSFNEEETYIVKATFMILNVISSFPYLPTINPLNLWMVTPFTLQAAIPVEAIICDVLFWKRFLTKKLFPSLPLQLLIRCGLLTQLSLSFFAGFCFVRLYPLYELSKSQCKHHRRPIRASTNQNAEPGLDDFLRRLNFEKKG